MEVYRGEACFDLLFILNLLRVETNLNVGMMINIYKIKHGHMGVVRRKCIFMRSDDTLISDKRPVDT